jgi:hypothetical protein
MKTLAITSGEISVTQLIESFRKLALKLSAYASIG